MKNGFEMGYPTSVSFNREDILEKLSLSLSKAKSIEEMLSILRQRLKPIFGTTSILLCRLNEDKITYSIDHLLSISDKQSEFFRVYQESPCDYFDNYFNKVVEAGVPLFLEIDSHGIGKGNGIAAIFTMLRAEEVVAIPILELNHDFALFFDKSSGNGTDPENLFILCKSIALYLRLAFSKIQETKLLTRAIELHQQERRLHTILATCYTKKEVKNWLLRHFLPYIGAEHANISIISADYERYCMFLDTKKTTDDQTVSFAFRCSGLNLSGSVIDLVFTSRTLQKEIIIEENGAEINMYNIPLIDGDHVIAVLSIYTPNDHDINLKAIEPFEASIVEKLLFLKGQEEQLRISNERAFIKELRLALSSVYTSEGFLPILSEHLRKIWEYNDIALLIPLKELTRDGSYLNHFEAKRRAHPYFKEWLTNCLSSLTELQTCNEEYSVEVYDVKNLPVNKALKAEHLAFCKETGIKTALIITLQNDGKFIGSLMLFSEKTGFPELEPFFKFSLSFLLSLTTNSLISKDLLATKEKQRRSLIDLGKSLASFQNSIDLFDFIFNGLTNVISFEKASIVLVKSVEKQFSLLTINTFQNHQSDNLILSDTQWENIAGHQLLKLVVKKDATFMEAKDLPNELRPFLTPTSENSEPTTIGCFPIPIEHDISAVLFTTFPTDTDLEQATERFNMLVPYLTIALKNAKSYESLKKREQEQAQLLELSNQFAAIKSSEDFSHIVNEKLKKIFYFSHSVIGLIDEGGETTSPFILDPHSRNFNHPKFDEIVKNNRFSMKCPLFQKPITSGQLELFKTEEARHDRSMPAFVEMNYESGIKEIGVLAIKVEGKYMGFLLLFSDHDNSFPPEKLGIIRGISSQIAVAVSNLISSAKIAKQFQQIESYKRKLEEENLLLHEEIKTHYEYSEIIGDSPLMQNVFHLIDQVSQSDSTVLISGETGTGKELLARAIHNHSARKNKLMVKINCAAMPANLIESELFGHEKGSFTGAFERKIGKFELAHQGTLFLDEVGEMPLELQVKLLRVLQEREFERVGGSTAIKVNVRIIAATNRNLQQEVTAGTFRADLFYRLNVFPIMAPALRDRKQDMTMLVQHFIQKYNRKIGKEISGLSQDVMQKLLHYNWPGNVRELEHYIERAMLMTSGKIIKEIGLPENAPLAPANEHASTTVYNNGYSLKESEKQHLMSVLRQCNGKVAGPGGAAKLLGLPATTVYSKIKRLGLSKTYKL
ncbi:MULTISPECIES: sigma-54-dependent Fis family transcriptional regulator [Olivibacter]|uniref:Sigma 54-interacting transcriptional regulator n=2 Tax=Olivibacter TaxID=376469 RepID=A0ABV6HRY7_9SPHI